MFEHMAGHRAIVVTGPHRSGTTIAAEMIAHDTGKWCVREEAFNYRNIIEAERVVYEGGVIQGPYLLPWAPILDAHIVYVHRDHDAIAASVRRLRERGISTPLFSAPQALALWRQWWGQLNSADVVLYDALRRHPLWVEPEKRKRWGHRQTC
jgi:hypothetical protein